MAEAIESPPSYEDVIEEEFRVKKAKKLRFYFKLSFTVINALFSALAIFGLFLIRYSHVIPVHKLNVTIYCNDPAFNVTPIPIQDNAYAYFMVFTLLTIILVVGMIRFTFENHPYDILAKKAILEFWVFSSHFVFLIVAIELIKLATGIPCPYYFAVEDLKHFYCKPRDYAFAMPRNLKLVDDMYRTSFPSYRASIYSFCITFLYFYLDHYDILIGFHATQQCVMIVLGSYTSHLLIEYVAKGENHKIDIVVGLIIGALHALVAIRNTFGTIVYKRNHISMVAFKRSYDARSNENSNSFELQPLRQNQNDAAVSIIRNQLNNSRTPAHRCASSDQNRSLLRVVPTNINYSSEQVVPNIQYNG